MKVTAAALLFAVVPAALGSAMEEKRLFCLREESGEWEVQRFAPLIDLRKSPVFESAKYSGTWLSSVTVHRYNERYELAVEYKFDQAGALEKTIGRVRRWGRWSAEATLYWDVAGNLAEPRFEYLNRGGDSTYSAPEGADEFKNVFASVPAYRTLDAMPCGGRLSREVASSVKAGAKR